MPRVVLAYTGGLATSLCIHWLRMQKGFDVVTYTANVGQGVNLEPIGALALELGAESAHIGDLRARFVRDFAIQALRAGAVYESGYFLGTALTRPLIVKEMVKIAAENRCDFLAHGCSGRGNDRTRFEAAAAALAPHLKVLAPLEEWGLTSREARARCARRYGLRHAAPPAPEGGDEGSGGPDPFDSVDQNLWGVARRHSPAEGDPWEPVPESTYRLTVAPERAPDEPLEVRIGFRRGTPERLDGQPLGPVEMVEALNALGGKHGIGRNEVIEDRISGVKTREIYEAPAAAILYEAHRALETIVLPKNVAHWKGALSKKYADLVYDGLWWSDLREALDGFFARVQRKVRGEVRVRLYKGRATVRGVRSPFSLFDPGLAHAASEDAEEPCPAGVREARGYALQRVARAGRAEPRVEGGSGGEG